MYSTPTDVNIRKSHFGLAPPKMTLTVGRDRKRGVSPRGKSRGYLNKTTFRKRNLPSVGGYHFDAPKSPQQRRSEPRKFNQSFLGRPEVGIRARMIPTTERNAQKSHELHMRKIDYRSNKRRRRRSKEETRTAKGIEGQDKAAAALEKPSP